MQRINEKQLTQHYLSHNIQNELIALMSKSVIEEIIRRVKQAKYYAFLLDCTRDVSRVEQISIILRFCNSSTGAIEEHFVGFIAFAETRGEGKILRRPTAVFGTKTFSPKSAKLKVFKKASMTKNSWEAHASEGEKGDEMGISQR
ncbi:zinc finger MYM-type protein 1 [Trichonephila clavipes]|nr:zinc finger MYM-type protein 1 [Trichonephila clavipes]